MSEDAPEVMERLLDRTHAALRAAGEAQQIWARLQCTCGRPECEIHDPARHTVTMQLDALAAWWDPDGAGAAALLQALSPLAAHLQAETATTELDAVALLHRVRDVWLSGMGTPLGGPPGAGWLRDLEQVEARNAMLLEKLLERLAGARFGALAAAAAEHARGRLRRLPAEGRAACRRTLLAWIGDDDVLPQRTLLREHLLALLQEAPWSVGEARDVFQMAEDAATAVLAFGIADDRWVRAAYGAAEQVAPFSALRVALVLEDA